MTLIPVASIKIIGAPADNNWIIGTTYHLHIEEFSSSGVLISPPHALEEPYENPNWNCTDTYGLLTPILDTDADAAWRATYVPSAIGSDPIAATVTANDRIFNNIIATNNVP